jgi:GT2 family glycosyltransferase
VTATVVCNKNGSKERYGTLQEIVERFTTTNFIWPDGNYGFPSNVNRGMREVTLRGGKIYACLRAKIIREEETWQTPLESSLTLA